MLERGFTAPRACARRSQSARHGEQRRVQSVICLLSPTAAQWPSYGGRVRAYSPSKAWHRSRKNKEQSEVCYRHAFSLRKSAECLGFAILGLQTAPSPVAGMKSCSFTKSHGEYTSGQPPGWVSGESQVISRLTNTYVWNKVIFSS